MTFQVRFALVSLFFGCAAASPGAEPGVETGPCVDGGCFDGLECLSEICVEPEGGTDSGVSASGSSASGSSASGSSASGSTSTMTGGESDPSDPSDPSAEETGPPVDCNVPQHSECDGGGGVFRAMGLNCPGEPEFTVSSQGNPGSIGLRGSFGSTDTWAPTEGEQFAVVGSGFLADLDLETPPGDPDVGPTYCSDDLGAEYDLGTELPGPLNPLPSGGDCVADPGHVGSGDCSGTLQAVLTAGGTVNDYSELRMAGAVPGGATSVSFDFAFFSAEYPYYLASSFNDALVVWLESERWTGNVTYDGEGAAVSINGTLLDVRDDAGTAPEFAGTCMRQHGGSNWHTTTAPVAPDEDITLVFAVMDLGDSIVDSYAFVDNVRFGCDPLSEPETALAN